jgi:hypothetical protein
MKLFMAHLDQALCPKFTELVGVLLDHLLHMPLTVLTHHIAIRSDQPVRRLLLAAQ